MNFNVSGQVCKMGLNESGQSLLVGIHRVQKWPELLLRGPFSQLCMILHEFALAYHVIDGDLGFDNLGQL